MTSAAEIYRAYIQNPYKFWTGPALRQAEKLEQKKRRLVEEEGWSLAEIPDRLLEQAAHRHPSPAVYITGLGGSGSHWLAGMLGETAAFFDAGEVYFPPLLVERFQEEVALVPQLVDALHLLHARTGVTGRERPVNCAAGASHTSRYLAWDPAATVVYLIRDPRDQVLSATFRKEEYRSFLGAEAEDDRSYLMRRCELSRSDRRGYVGGGISADMTIRYEQLRASPHDSLASVLAAAGAHVDAEELNRIVERHDARRIMAAEEKPVGNINVAQGLRNWVEEPPRWVAAVHGELSDVIESLGYPFGRCLVDPLPVSPGRRPEPPPPGIRLRAWTGQEWSMDSDGGPWLAEVLSPDDDQGPWLSRSPIFGVCAVRVRSFSDFWFESVVTNPHLRTLDLGTVPISPTQARLLVGYGSRLRALGLWRSLPDPEVKRIRAELPTTTVIA